MSKNTKCPIPLNPAFEWFRQINAQNMSSMFDPARLLPGSLFYPASADDGKDIENASWISQSFVHVDYRLERGAIEEAMRHDFHHIGYDLVGILDVKASALTPQGWKPSIFSKTSFERGRLKSVERPTQHINPFALWAIYRLRKDCAKPEDKAEMFSLLHIGGEACATFDALYVNQKYRPKAVCILYPGHGYGDNWTNFFEPDDCLYRLVQMAGLPEYLIQSLNLPWPGYAPCPIPTVVKYDIELGQYTLWFFRRTINSSST